MQFGMRIRVGVREDLLGVSSPNLARVRARSAPELTLFTYFAARDDKDVRILLR